MEFSKVAKLIEGYVSKYGATGMKSSAIAKLMLDENEELSKTQTLQHLSLLVYEVMSSEDDAMIPSDKTIDVDCDDREKYQVIDDHYVWETSKSGTIRISVSDADKMFYEYSRFGLNLSQEEVRRKHGFTIPQWNSIKSTLWLYKNANIFSPHTSDNTPANDMQEMLSDKFSMKFNDKSRLIEEEYRKHTLKEYKKVINNYQVDRFASTEFLHEISALLPDREVVTVNKATYRKDDPDKLLVAIADLHIGAKVEGLRKTQRFDKEVLKARLSDISETVNEYKSKNVTLCILGDIIESFTGLNHPNSWQSMEYGVHGARVVVDAVNILSSLFDKVNNLSCIKIIGGNHDRSTSCNKVDRQSTIAEIIFYMLKDKYQGVYEIEYDTLVLTHDFDNTRFILAHGDKNVLKKAGSSLDAKVIEFGDKDKFNVILTGHLHSRSVKEDKVHYRWYGVPSVFSGNFYSEENGWNAKPGFSIITECKRTKLPKFMDCPLS